MPAARSRFNYRYSVMLLSREAINEALLKRSVDFASRPFVPTHSFYNPGLNGTVF